MSKIKKIIIVGGVAAGASAAARLRRLDENAEILVLERGEFVSFANCGLPYHIGGEISRRRDLLISTPETFRENFNVEVRTRHEVVAIDRKNRSVDVADLASGTKYREQYDKLILSQGAFAVTPDIPGSDHPRIHTLRDIPDMDRIKSLVDSGARNAIVIGAGYVGLETAEALSHRGLSIHLVELQSQVLPMMDPELASDLAEHIKEKGVRLVLGTAPISFADENGRVSVELEGRDRIIADFVLIAIGVRPETALATAAGLDIGMSGGVRVDRQMRTSDPDIYAAGDMVEITDTVTGNPAVMPLAGPANRQGRTAADAICGRDSGYRTTQGTAIVKVFDMTAALTGASEKSLRRKGRAYSKLYLWPFGHAAYYPGTAQMHVKVLFDPENGAILGAQIAGSDGVDKRIDIFAVAIRAGLTVFDLEHLELAYSPPYGSAKDPVNMAGFVGANILNGDVRFWYCEDYPEKTAAGTILDVRTKKEYQLGHIPGAVNIPLDEARARIEDLKSLQEPLYIYCLTGIRSYLVYRILHANGFEQIYNLAGGWKTYESYQRSL